MITNQSIHLPLAPHDSQWDGNVANIYDAKMQKLSMCYNLLKNNNY